MLLHPTTAKPPLQSHHAAPSFSSSISFRPGFCSSGPLKPITAHESPSFIACSSISRVHSYGAMFDEKRPMLNWNGIYRKISMMENPEMGPAAVLNQSENEGKPLTKWELSKVVKQLRKFKRFNLALQVYEWMNSRGERFRMTTSDTAIQLDLIAKVQGISAAEEYFLKLSDGLKDNRIYGALLNAYVHARMKEKAETLIDKMRIRGYANHPLPFNVMMTLYMNSRDYDKVEAMVSEMMEKRIPLDNYSYNIWISTRGTQGSAEKMEQAFEHMKMDSSISPNWTTFSTMATMYIKLEKPDKAEECLKKLESRITGRDRMPYHYLISLYGSISKKEEVLRIWNIYKSVFPNIPNLGYHAVISSLVRLNDIQAAEQIYEEWLPVKSRYDPRIANLLLGWYLRNGFTEKAEAFFSQVIEVGGRPNSATWEILAESHIREKKMSEALSCLKNAAEIKGSQNWRPKPANVSSILKLCVQEADTASKEALMEVLKQVGCLDSDGYMSYIHSSHFTRDEESAEIDKSDEDDDGAEVLLNQLQSGL